MLVVLLFGIIFVREPRLQQSEEIFLRFLLGSSQTQTGAVPLTIVDLGNKQGATSPTGLAEPGETFLSGAGNANSGPYNTLFFTAGPHGENDGLFGTLVPLQAELTEADEP